MHLLHFYRSSDAEDYDDAGSESPMEDDDISKEPELVMPLRNKTGISGRSIKLGCRVYCPVEMEIEWLKGRKPVKENQRVMFEVEDELHSLTINKLRLSDAGDYKVIFKNKYGSVESKCELSVRGKEELVIFSERNFLRESSPVPRLQLSNSGCRPFLQAVIPFAWAVKYEY